MSDFEYELQLSAINKVMEKEIETIFVMSSYDLSFISSSSVKEMAKFGGDISNFVPKVVKEAIKENNMSVIISSHNLQELENLCDHIGIINGKKISVTGAVSELSYGKTKFRLAFKRQFTLDEFKDIPCENLIKDGQLALFTVNGNTETIEKQIKELKPDVTEKINLSLEEIFMQEMKGEDYDYKSILY